MTDRELGQIVADLLRELRAIADWLKEVDNRVIELERRAGMLK